MNVVEDMFCKNELMTFLSERLSCFYLVIVGVSHTLVVGKAAEEVVVGRTTTSSYTTSLVL